MPKTVNKNNKSSNSGLISRLRRYPKAKLAYFSMVGIVLVSALGLADTEYYQLRTQKASAAGWTNLSISSGAKLRYFRACKTLRQTTYGGVYYVKFQAERMSGSNIVGIGGRALRLNRATNSYTVINQSNQNNWLYGVVAGSEVAASQAANDKVDFHAGGRTGTSSYFAYLGGSSTISPSNLATC